MLKGSITIVFLSVLLSGCASTSTETLDPYEDINRKIYDFNRRTDKMVLKPIAKGYHYVTPQVIQNRVSDFFGNLEDVTTMANNILQGKFKAAGVDLSRFVINTTVGIGGLFDIASRAGITQNDEDFGQTLGVWGVPTGPYVMLPFFGPKTLRSTAGTAVNFIITSDWVQPDDSSARNAMRGIELLDTRVSLFPIESNLEDTIDEYIFVRQAYLQSRQYKVYDGNVPVDPNQEDIWDDIDTIEEEEECTEECF